MKIYELFVNLVPNENNETFNDKAGAYVHLYVTAIDLELSIEKMKKYVELDNFSVKDIEHVRVIDLDDWDEERDDDSPTVEQLSQLILNNNFIYGEFHSYEFEYEH
ncbi:hypothetical protein ACUR5C_07210 [Aliikangiella sp. IMCC44653]